VLCNETIDNTLSGDYLIIYFMKKLFQLYPFFLGMYSVMSLIAHTRAEMVLWDGFRAILFSALLAALLFTAFRMLIKETHKAALITAFVLILLYSYGHVIYFLRQPILAGVYLGRHRILIPVFLFVLVTGITLLAKSNYDSKTISEALTPISAFLIIFPLSQIIYYSALSSFEANARNQQIKSELPVSLPSNGTRPDVYYILLDGYPRSDFIARFLGADISEFIEELSERGFYVARCSQSNYTDTRFSMAATLNMRYLDKGTGEPEVLHSGTELDNMIRFGEVQRNFAGLGYRIITFASGYKWLKWAESDVHLDPARYRAKRTFLSIGINDFEYLFLNTTAFKIILDLPFVIDNEHARFVTELINSPRASHRDRVFFALDQLPTIARTMPNPKFVYAHLIFPHPPYIVDADGNPLQNTPSDELKAYGDQILYLNKRLIDIIDEILSEPGYKPLIILQGDHGATIDYAAHQIDKAYRLGIMNAYFLPGLSPGTLYDTVTPVNTFRIIFDHYFQGNYGLLEDKSIIGRQSPFTTLECYTH